MVQFSPDSEIRKKRFLCDLCSRTISTMAKLNFSREATKRKIRETGKVSGYLSKKLKSPGFLPRGCKRRKLDSGSSSQTDDDKIHTSQQHTKKKYVSFKEVEIDRAIQALQRRHYKKAVTILCKNRVGFRNAIFSMMETVIREELSNFCKKTTSCFVGGKNLEGISEFDWDDNYNEMKNKCPLLTRLLVSALTSKLSARALTCSTKKMSIKPVLGSIHSMILYSKKPRQFNNLQQINSLQLWLAGCKREVSFKEVEIDRAIQALQRRHYKKAVTILCKNRVGFRNAIFSMMETVIREELSNFCKKTTSCFVGGKNLEGISEFDWDDNYNEMKNKCPLLTRLLVSALTSKLSARALTCSTKKMSIKPVLGSIHSMILYSKKPRQFNNLQQINSLQLWLAGCKREVFARFSHIGFCTGISSTKAAIDRIRKNYNADVYKWKDSVTNYFLLPPEPEIVSDMESSDDAMTELPNPTSAASSSPLSLIDNECPPCFSVCFDNVNQKVTVRHQTRDNKNKMFNMVQSFAALDRVPTLHLSDEVPSPDNILNIPLQSYLPSETDEINFKKSMMTMISRILCKYIPIFEDLTENIEWHIKHKFTNESNKKSVLVPLGVLDKDESKVADTIEIMENYQQYLPIKPNGKPLTVPLHADGLSCERGNDAQSARINASTPWTQLQGFVLNIQEWHKRCLLLQDIYDNLYKSSSGREKGTLYHLKNYFNHRSVTTNTKESFNYNEEFLEFCTEGYLVLAAMHFMDIKEINETPDGFPSDKEHKLEYMDNVCRKINDMVFLSSQHTVKKILDDNADEINTEDEYCFCKRHIPGSKMIYCSGKDCPNIWYHLDCLEMEDVDVPEGKWYCCDSCKCKKMDKETLKKKSISESLTDSKLNYTILLMWNGLQQILRRDAIRENDGPRIISHWKFDMLNYVQNHHPKYFLVGHRLLSAVNGAVSPRLQETLIWNRTLNPNGGIGKNIGMDLQMEYFNKEYKESVKEAAGQMTTATIDRHSQMVGVGKILRNLYETKVSKLSRSFVQSHNKTDRTKDIQEFISLMTKENVYQSHPGRCHATFPNTDLNIHKNVIPQKMKNRLTRIRAEMSKRRKVINKMQD